MASQLSNDLLFFRREVLLTHLRVDHQQVQRTVAAMIKVDQPRTATFPASGPHPSDLPHPGRFPGSGRLGKIARDKVDEAFRVRRRPQTGGLTAEEPTLFRHSDKSSVPLPQYPPLAPDDPEEAPVGPASERRNRREPSSDRAARCVPAQAFCGGRPIHTASEFLLRRLTGGGASHGTTTDGGREARCVFARDDAHGTNDLDKAKAFLDPPVGTLGVPSPGGSTATASSGGPRVRRSRWGNQIDGKPDAANGRTRIRLCRCLPPLRSTLGSFRPALAPRRHHLRGPRRAFAIPAA